MGNICSSKKETKSNYDNKNKPNQDGPVGHREAAQNRVSEDEIQLAEVKSRINKIQQYRKKMEK